MVGKLIAHVPDIVAFLPERRRGADPSAQPFREGELRKCKASARGGWGTQFSVQRADANLGTEQLHYLYINDKNI